MRRLIRISLSFAIVAVLAFVLLIAASVHTFNALTNETLIAELEFERVADKSYLAYLRTGDFCAEEVYALLGDQWRIDAQFLKWHYWATLLGLESQYRLERLEGRYRDVDEQNLSPNLAHGLAPPSAIDIGGLSGGLGPFNFLADASYGSSTYHDIDPTQLYLVFKSPTGIFTRARARTAAETQPGRLDVEIRHDCGAGPGVWERTAAWINGTVDRVH
jgi:hypothetical protein